MRVQNLRIRFNKGVGDGDDLLGWIECLLSDGVHTFHVNNIRVKVRTDGEGLKVVIDYPHKLANVRGEEKKVFYVKPVTKESYALIEAEVIRFMKESAKKG